jgi:hypothetical protein
VLLYQVVKCWNSKGLSLEEQIRNVFDQHTEMDHDGNVTGGTGKVGCLYKLELSERIVRKLVKTPCRKIIEELPALFLDFYLLAEEGSNLSGDSDSGGSSTTENERKKVQEATKKLSSSEWILEMINGYLSSKWDVDDDSSLHKTSVRLR